ncbi:MAG: hypothetical protein NTY17_05400 [Planctomycetia bacterium]|nr:hypothetical protein [Planctomycetia bacterium]
MATDDDKQVPEPDPWAGLDSGGAEDAAAEDAADFTFAFEGSKDDAADDIPLVVFPPPDVEATGSEVHMGSGMGTGMGTERSDIISMTNAVDNSGEEDFDDHDAAGDSFDDNDIAHEMGLLDAEGEAIAAEALASGDDFDDAADFGEPVNEAHSDDTAESWPDDPASIPLNTAVAATGAAGAALVMAGDRPAAAKKKGSGFGQMVGVVLGGLMALPITYAILIWGFQKDPFKLGKQVPSQLAFLLPEKLQPGYQRPRKAGAGPNLDAAPSLDDLPSADEPMPTTPDPAATTAAESAESEPTEPTKPAEPTPPSRRSLPRLRQTRPARVLPPRSRQHRRWPPTRALRERFRSRIRCQGSMP